MTTRPVRRPERAFGDRRGLNTALETRFPAPSVEGLEATYHLEALNLGYPISRFRYPTLSSRALEVIRNYDPMADNLQETWRGLSGAGYIPEIGRVHVPLGKHKPSGEPRDDHRVYITAGDRMIYYEPANHRDGEPARRCALSWIVALLNDLTWPPATRHLTQVSDSYAERASAHKSRLPQTYVRNLMRLIPEDRLVARPQRYRQDHGGLVLMYPPMGLADLVFTQWYSRAARASADPYRIERREIWHAMKLIVPIDDIRAAMTIEEVVDGVSRFCPSVPRERLAFYIGQWVYSSQASHRVSSRFLAKQGSTLFYQRSVDGRIFQSTKWLPMTGRQWYVLPPHVCDPTRV